MPRGQMQHSSFVLTVFITLYLHAGAVVPASCLASSGPAAYSAAMQLVEKYASHSAPARFKSGAVLCWSGYHVVASQICIDQAQPPVATAINMSSLELAQRALSGCRAA
jgi:hypothetical protein